ncbi:MAG: GumC family protein, partial [Gammaproteobacteria bacterium]
LPPNLNLTHEEAPEFVEYWRAVMQRKWSILALAVLVAAIAYVAVSQMDPVYRSSATVLIESERQNLVPIGEAYNRVEAYYREYFQTQAEVLKSRTVAQRVITKLKLTEHPEFDPRQEKPSVLEKWMNAYFPGLGPKPVGARDEASLETEVLKRFADGLSIEPVRLSQLVKVSFEAHDRALAAAAANATVEAYIQADLDARYKMSENAGQLINQPLADLKEALDASERALQAYRDREGMLDNKSTVLSGTGTQLDELTQELVGARVRRSEVEEAHNQVKAGKATNYESVPAVVKSLSVQRAKEVEAEAEKRVAEVSQEYGPEHPKFVAANSDLSAARANTRRQIQNLVASVVKEYEAARATEKTIAEALEQSKGTIRDLNRKEIQLGVLEREAATNRKIYQTFLSRFKETSAIKIAQGSNAR